MEIHLKNKIVTQKVVRSGALGRAGIIVLKNVVQVTNSEAVDVPLEIRVLGIIANEVLVIHECVQSGPSGLDGPLVLSLAGGAIEQICGNVFME